MQVLQPQTAHLKVKEAQQRKMTYDLDSGNTREREKEQERQQVRLQLISELDEAKTEDGSCELVTLYIPPNRNILDVIKQIGEETTIASNIKSEKTRKAVQNALHQIGLNLIADGYGLLREDGTLPPENGMVIFSGAREPNTKHHLRTHQQDFTVLVPPNKKKPVDISLLLIHDHFYTEKLKELIS